MKDSPVSCNARLNLTKKFSYLLAFVLVLLGSSIFHYAKESSPMVKPFGALVFMLGMAVLALAMLISAGNWLRSGVTDGREVRGWVLMLVAIALLVGSVAEISTSCRTVLFENVPERHFLVVFSSDQSSVELYFQSGSVFRSPFRRSFAVPQDNWVVQFSPQFTDMNGLAVPMLLSFNCSVNPECREKFSAAFGESLRQVSTGQRVPAALLGPITRIYESSIDPGLAGRQFKNVQEMEFELAESLKRCCAEAGLKVSEIKLVPLAAPQRPAPPQIGRPFV